VVTVDPTDGLGQEELLRRLKEVAGRAALIAVPEGGFSIELLNHSENSTYLITKASTGERLILRVHRTGYHSRAAIESELIWMEALRAEAGVHTPRVIAGPDGTRVHEVFTEALPGGRNCVFFEFLEGEEPDENDLISAFPNLGEVTAKMHRHVRGWRLPAGFERFRWDFDTALGRKPHWGHWYEGPAMTAPRRAVLARLVDAIGRRLERFGSEPERFGLVHCDMRLANLLVYQGDTRVIDFDDCGFSWFLYDLAAALSFIEHRPDVPDLVSAWLQGYRRVASVTPAEEREIPTFIMFRRMLLVAWIGSHAETDLARQMGADYTAVSCDLAEDYLGKFG